MTTHFRAYEPRDFDTIYSIDQECYSAEIAYSRPELREYLLLPGADCILAETPRRRSSHAKQDRIPLKAMQQVDRSIVGFCLTAHAGAEGHVITMDVLESFRRRGVGSQLLARAEQRLAEYGVRQVSLEAAVDNTPAIAFWQNHGYRTRSILKGYYPGGRHALSMSKALAASV